MLAFLLLCVANVLSAESACASDEDLTSSAYLVFDPETGEFVTVQDANRVKQKHDALDPALAATKPGSESATLPLVAGVVLAFAVLGGVIFLLRRKRAARPDSAGTG
ncbi:MAG TPA: hypothetical protein VFG91_07840 [Woeseiaceae bacterium]|nr:hypothetical protein [Woeseiaceae bacterium]